MGKYLGQVRFSESHLIKHAHNVLISDFSILGNPDLKFHHRSFQFWPIVALNKVCDKNVPFFTKFKFLRFFEFGLMYYLVHTITGGIFGQSTSNLKCNLIG